MQSPPDSPLQNLQGASQIVRGFSRGHAQGNVFNFADASDIVHEPEVRPMMGKVLLYTSMGDPTLEKPVMSLCSLDS